MNVLTQSLTNLLLLLYYWLEGIVLFFVPRRLRHKDVKGEIVLITGGGSGLGRLLAIRFAKLGSKIVLWDLNQEGLKETAKIIFEQFNEQANYYVCDVSDRNIVYQTAEKVKQDVGNVTILINNAGIVTGKRLIETPDDMIVKTFQVNAISHFWVSQF